MWGFESFSRCHEYTLDLLLNQVYTLFSACKLLKKLSIPAESLEFPFLFPFPGIKTNYMWSKYYAEALEEAEENGEGWGYLDEKHLEVWLESEEEKWMEDADERFPDWYYDKHYPDWKSSLYEEWLEEEAS